jgi:hypothetical protein
MFSRMTIELTTPSGVAVEHRLIAHDDSVGLLVILPGRGYTCDYPLLHYLRKAAADLGWDVLSVWYSFQVAAVPDDQITLDGLAAEVDAAIREALKRGYRRVCIAGKSLGTPLATLYTRQAERLILLTPLGTAAADTGALPALAVIGTADPQYQPDVIDTSSDNVRWLVLDGLDHSLEAPGDWARSLDALHTVIAACTDFLA